ncbi:MAG: hypothetical protein QHC67_12880 [Sphingobium sp.]|nr:hypothetical protein [Sphingobium sp.]MDX3910694.1 hypothetical protein [Sphingobium sp.]
MSYPKAGGMSHGLSDITDGLAQSLYSVALREAQQVVATLKEQSRFDVV